MRWQLATLGLAAAAALTLSGCMRFSADLTVKEDNTVDGSYVIAVEKGSGAAMGGSDTSVAQDLFDDSGLQTHFERGWTHPYAKDGYSGVEVTFRDEPLSSFAPTDDRFGIIREGDEFVVSGKASSTEANEAADAGDSPQMTVTIAFPGPVASANGTIDGNTVTWNLVGGPPILEARASAISNSSPWPSIGATALVLLALGVTFWPRAPSRPDALAGRAQKSPRRRAGKAIARRRELVTLSRRVRPPVAR